MFLIYSHSASLLLLCDFSCGVGCGVGWLLLGERRLLLVVSQRLSCSSQVESSWAENGTYVPCIGSGFLTTLPPGKFWMCFFEWSFRLMKEIFEKKFECHGKKIMGIQRKGEF